MKLTAKRVLTKPEKWVPKKWKPIYEEIVLRSAAGSSNEEIAVSLGYTTQQISNILNTPQAKEVLAGIGSRVREKFQESFGERIENLTLTALTNMEVVLKDETVREVAPLQMFDRSLSYLKAAGKLQGDSPKGNTTNIVIGVDVQKNLLTGLQKANRVQEIYTQNGPGTSALPPPKNS